MSDPEQAAKAIESHRRAHLEALQRLEEAEHENEVREAQESAKATLDAYLRLRGGL